MSEVLTVVDMAVGHIEAFGKMMVDMAAEAPRNYSVTPEYLAEYVSGQRFMDGMAKSIASNKAGRFVALDGQDCLMGAVETVARDDSLRIGNMYVVPPARSHGIGALLLSACEERALYDDCPRLSLVVGSENHDARRFYEYHGFHTLNPPELVTWEIHPGVYGETLAKEL
ncbi:MAG: family N-acetyltransferase [Candidatus Saccharibacteria bacterium]|nr:family N-acetyltransferase [Candidatus Saccharibacteria bacterium]